MPRFPTHQGIAGRRTRANGPPCVSLTSVVPFAAHASPNDPERLSCGAAKVPAATRTPASPGRGTTYTPEGPDPSPRKSACTSQAEDARTM